jgi:hypothetical protein
MGTPHGHAPLAHAGRVRVERGHNPQTARLELAKTQQGLSQIPTPIRNASVVLFHPKKVSILSIKSSTG